MRRGLVAANWKMHGSKQFAAQWVGEVLAGRAAHAACELVLCPPAPYLEHLGRLLQGSDVRLGAQNLYPGEQGAFTGEIAAGMLTDMGCSHVIVGHSERRDLFGEDDALVAMKFVAAQAKGLTPILCVGESEAQRRAGDTQAVVLAQLDAVIQSVEAGDLARAVLAYEPVWAIGTGLTATPEQAQEVHAVLRARLAKVDKALADTLPILYGGSVKAGNAAELFDQPDIDGALVGGASLDGQEFNRICSAMAKALGSNT